jgi:DNA segregation ATPase FtsK/SpoIIIE, S-DNA-T family
MTEETPKLAAVPDLPSESERVLAPLAPPPLTPVDPTRPIRPEWMTDRSAASSTAKRFLLRNLYRLRRLAFTLPVAVVLLVLYSPRGVARIVAKVSAYLYDYDSAAVRHQHAGKVETAEYVKAQNIRKANLKARWLVATTITVLVVAPVLAYLAPAALGVIAGLMLCVIIVKAIPGRSMGELVVGAIAGTVFGLVVWWGCGKLPVIPLWPVVAVGVLIDLALGWVGRPDRPLTAADNSARAGELEKPTAPLVIAALGRLGVPDLNDKTAEEIRVYAPGVARGKRGYTIELELPGAVTASAVMDKREQLAGGLKRKLGTVWPSRGPNHPGHLVLFISDQPMNEAPQPRWKVAEGRELDIFQPMPQFTDQQGRWVDLTLAYNHFVVGGAPGFGKSFAVRQLGVAAAFDPRVQIITMDGKGNGDLRPLRLVAHAFHEGDEDDEIKEQLSEMRKLREEMRRRNRFLRDLPIEENPQNKVTSALVDKYPHLAPIVLLVDETQVYTEHEDRDIKQEFIRIFTDLVKRGRSAGIIPVFCTQKPDAQALPSGIAANCSQRLAFKVNGQIANDQVLGSEMHKNGVKATLFSGSDKGIAYLKGDGQDAQIVRTVAGLDQVKAEELTMLARAIREARGLLTGYAAGEEAEAEEEQVNFLADCRTAMNTAKSMLLAELLVALGKVNGHWSELDVDALGSMLNAAGVKRGTVWSPGKKASGYGVKLEWLDVAATSDVDPDEDGDAA